MDRCQQNSHFMQQNAKFIQALNDNIHILSQNVEMLQQQMIKLDEGISSLNRDAAAMQRATIAFLHEKGLLQDEEDFKLLEKLRLRQIAILDQEIAKRKEERSRDNLI